MSAAEELGKDVGMVAACSALGVSRASVYRRRQPAAPSREPRRSHRALTKEEQENVLAVLNSERFVDKAPAEVFAALLSEGEYLASPRTMYRILAANKQVRERRNQRRHPDYAKPELLATGPNQLWSWDITKLKGPRKWTYFHLYVVLDVYSRYVVGWTVAERESASLAKRLLSETIEKQELEPTQLTIHADRGSSMRSKLVAQLLGDLGVTKTHSRPHTSNDNPFSESQFKTMKYCPAFPKNFGSLEDARAFCRDFFGWYNGSHHHQGIAHLTPYQVHYGHAEAVLALRQRALDEAFARHPERFARPPRVATLPGEVWINPPPTPSSATEGGSRGAGGLTPDAKRLAPAPPADRPAKEPSEAH